MGSRRVGLALAGRAPCGCVVKHCSIIVGSLRGSRYGGGNRLIVLQQYGCTVDRGAVVAEFVGDCDAACETRLRLIASAWSRPRTGDRGQVAAVFDCDDGAVDACGRAASTRVPMVRVDVSTSTVQQRFAAAGQGRAATRPRTYRDGRCRNTDHDADDEDQRVHQVTPCALRGACCAGLSAHSVVLLPLFVWKAAAARGRGAWHGQAGGVAALTRFRCSGVCLLDDLRGSCRCRRCMATVGNQPYL